MDDQTIVELQRLERIIQQGLGATRGLSTKISELSQRVSNIEIQRAHDKENDDRKEKQIDRLADLIDGLKTQLDILNGKNQGIASTSKTFWTLFGGILIASVLGISGIMWNFNSEISSIKATMGRNDERSIH